MVLPQRPGHWQNPQHHGQEVPSVRQARSCSQPVRQMDVLSFPLPTSPLPPSLPPPLPPSLPPSLHTAMTVMNSQRHSIEKTSTLLTSLQFKSIFLLRHQSNRLDNLPLPLPHLTPSPPLMQELPPYNGFGSTEDSKQSCLSLVPQPPKKDFIKMLENDGKVLRFAAVMVRNVV